MKRVTAQFDTSRLLADRPIRMAMADGLHVRVVQRISIEEAHELLAELARALAYATAAGHDSPQNYPISAGGTD